MKKFLVVLTLLTLLSLASTKLIGDIDSDEASVLNLFELWDKRQIETNKAATEDRESRIVGGQFATPSQFPYQCALLTHHAGVTVHCGGSVISTVSVKGPICTFLN